MTGDESPVDPVKPPASGTPSSRPSRSAFSDDFDNANRPDAGDELPEDEPLTPELVEDEAIRGDFMLRWAIVLLAVLMAFGRMNDTKPLVLIRSGDFMRANGFLPPRVDQFSFTAGGKPVSNVSWLFDHLVSLAWLIGGHAGLTALKAGIAGLSSWLLLRISVPGVSTWWGSICGLLAVLACSSDYWPLPELITLLGMTLTMRLLFEHRQNLARGLNWKLPLLIAVWCNLDSRAWVGAGVIVAYAMGHGLTRRIRARREESGRAAAADATGGLALPALFSVLALLVNPFPGPSLFSPLTTYSIEYPAMQAQRTLLASSAAVSFDGRADYYSVLNPSAIVLFDQSQPAAVLLVLVAIGVLLTSRSVRDLSFWFVLLFVAGLSLLASHELPAAAIVAAVVATVTAQEWYRRTFSMKYSVDAQELLFSRGGRAATVVAIATIGFCVVTSRFPGAVPLGLGFDDDTRITMDAFVTQTQSLPADARVLHTRMEQGDLLIWNGRKSFIDSRVMPFGRPGDARSIAGQHSNMREILMLPPKGPPQTQDPDEKRRIEETRANNQAAAIESLDAFGVTHALIRLAPPGDPDFASMATLMQSGQWFAVSVGPAAGILERVMPGRSSPADLQERGVSFSKLAFRNETADPPATRLVATPPSFYERYVYRTRSFTDASKREARNFLQFAQVPAQSLPDIMTSISNSTLAIRRLNQSLASRPGDAESYEMLFRAYGQLGAMEQSVLTGQSAGRLRQLRYFQSIAACHQALIINPDSLFAWDGLAAAYQQLGRQDLLVTALSNWVRIAEPLPEFEEGVLGEELIRRKQGLAELREQVETANAQITKDMEDRRKQAEQAQLGQPSGDTPTAPGAPSPEQILLAQLALAEATLANTNGLPGRALQTLKDNQALLQSDPYARLLLGQLLLENGEIEDATAILPGLKLDAESQPAMFASLEWHLPVATLEMVLANYSLASATFGNQLAAINKRATDGAPYAGVLFSLPLVADVQFNALNMPVPIWPVQNAASTVESMQAVGEVRSEILLLAALTSIEAGDMKAARNHLQAIITECGDTGSRPLAMLYYSVATEQEETQKLFDSLALNGTEEYLFPGEVLPTMEQLQQAAQAAQAAQGAAAGAMPPAGARGQTGAAGQPGAAGSGATSNPPGAGPAGAAPVRLSPGSLPGGAPQP